VLRRDVDDEEVLQRFEREVQFTARLTHPNTIAIYDYGHTPEGVFYYAMEYLDGANSGVASAAGAQPPARVIHVLVQVRLLAGATPDGAPRRQADEPDLRARHGRLVKIVDFGRGGRSSRAASGVTGDVTRTSSVSRAGQTRRRSTSGAILPARCGRVLPPDRIARVQAAPTSEMTHHLYRARTASSFSADRFRRIFAVLLSCLTNAETVRECRSARRLRVRDARRWTRKRARGGGVARTPAPAGRVQRRPPARCRSQPHPDRVSGRPEPRGRSGFRRARSNYNRSLGG
jgi:hypothetical protein